MLALLHVAATGAYQCASVAPSTAKLFTYEDFGEYQRVNSTQCGESYILYPRGQTAPSLGSSYKYFGVPLDKVAVTQTVTNTFIELLGKRENMLVSSQYSTSACIAKRVVDGDASAYVRPSSDSAGHATQMENSDIEAIFSDPWYTSSWPHAASASKVICEASTYETSPLGSAEWVKFFGYLFGASDQANAVYCGTHSRYSCNSLVADNKNLGSTTVPKVLFTSKDWQGNYAIQMPPYKDQFVHDAGAVYPDLAAFQKFMQMHWTGTQVSSFKFPAANISQFHAALKLADVLIDETYPHGQTMTSITDAYALPSVTVGQTFMAGGDDPASGSTGWSLVSHGIGEKLFTVNSAGDIVPLLASSVSKNSDGTWTLTLASGKKFSDGTPLTAAIVKTSLERTNAANNAAQSSFGMLTMTAQDDSTLTISTTIATPVMMSVLAEWWAVVYHTNSTGGRVFTGPYAIQHHDTTNNILRLIPNTHYPNAKQRQPITVKKYSSGGAVSTALVNGEIDMGFNLPPDSVAQLNWRQGLSVKSFPVGYQYMMFMNTNPPNRTAVLADVKVRKAIALAIDRSALATATVPPGITAETVTDAVATGAFPTTSPWAPTTKLPTDTTEAARLLDEAGWTVGSGGLREKNISGVMTPLSLDLVYYTFRADLVTMAPLIESQLAALGITATPRVNDNGDYMDGTQFDLLLWAQHTLPAGDPNWFFETFFKTMAPISGSWKAQNFAQLSSPTIDAALTTLSTAEGAARVTAATAVHNAILDEVPATFLTSPVWHVGLNDLMASYEPWGSDYFVIKTDMPKTDWPTAIVDGRVYTLDGTMDANGPPYGGTDWYESRVAEPDEFLTDLIAVAHPTGSDYAPSDLHYLRHAGTGTTTSVTASQCTDASAPRPIRAASCDALIEGTTDLSLTALLNGVKNADDGSMASPPPPAAPVDVQDNTIYVVLIIVMGILVVIFLAMAVVCAMKAAASKPSDIKPKSTTATPPKKDTEMGQVSASASSASSASS